MPKLSKLLSYLRKNKNQDLCIVFDLGSASVKMLIGPTITIDNLNAWNPFTWFHIETRNFELYKELDFNGEIDVNKPAFQKTIQFINKIGALLKSRAKKNDFILVGTEAFRVATNQNQLLKKIKAETELEVTVLDKQSEAFLSLLAVIYTYKNTSVGANVSEIKNGDIILLFDQGGGSTEISYHRLKNYKIINHLSLSQVGTIATRNRFFNDDDNSSSHQEHIYSISERFELVSELIEKEIDLIFDQHTDLVELSKLSGTVHAFVTGSTFRIAMEQLMKRNGKQLHCHKITVKDLEVVLKESCYELQQSDEQVKFLINLLNEPTVDSDLKNAIEEELLLIFGLPTYIKLLRRFNLKEARYSYFNLKHGVFFAKTLYGFDNTNLLTIQIEQILKEI